MLTSQRHELSSSDYFVVNEDYFRKPATTPTMNADDDFLHINVSGATFEALKSIFEMYPTTLLGNEKQRAPYFVKSLNAYFFDHNRQCFQAILNYYRTGLLVRPTQIPMNLFEMEISFFGLGEEAIKKVKIKEGYAKEEEVQEAELPENYYQRKIWELFEIPDSSIAAKIVACWSVLVITISVITFCLETVIMLLGQENFLFTS